MEPGDEPAHGGIRDLRFEMALALATLTLWPLLDRRRCGSAAQRARAMAFVPLVGLVFGIALALCDRGLSSTSGLETRSLAVLLVAAAATGGQGIRGFADMVGALRFGARPAPTGISMATPVGAAAALALFVLELWCFARIGDPAGRASALVMAATLSRWVMVPVGYGLKPLERSGLGVPYEGGITFREFAVSSVIALGLTMGLYLNVGLAVIVMLALLVLGMRLLFSRRLGGAPGFALAGASAVAELATFATLAALRG